MEPVKKKAKVEIPSSLYGRIDCTEVQDLIHSRRIQRLGRIKQLGAVSSIFPDNTHTRLSHTLGVFHLTRQRTDRLISGIDRGSDQLTGQEALEAQVAAIFHDVGHGPFSHIGEFRQNHNDAGIALVEGELRPLIEAHGVSADTVAAIMRKQNELSTLIYGIPGTDTLDYLVRDARNSFPGEVDMSDLLLTHVRWRRGVGLYVLPKGLLQAIAMIQRSWMHYGEIYERPSCRSYQRYLQATLVLGIRSVPGVEVAMDHGGEDGVMGALDQYAATCPEAVCSIRYRRMVFERSQPKKAIIFSPSDIVPLRNKTTFKREDCSPELIEASCDWDVYKLASMERKLAEIYDLKPYDVSIAAAPPKRRFKVPTCMVENSQGEIVPIAEAAPELVTAAALMTRLNMTIVVSVTPDERQRVIADPGLINATRELLERSA